MWWYTKFASLDGKISGPGIYWVEGKLTWLNPDANYTDPTVKELYKVKGHVTNICQMLK
jgi:hypothetical protein